MIDTMKDITCKLRKKLNTLFLFISVLFLAACHDECPTLQDYWSEGIGEKNCLLCPLFDIVTEAATAAAQNSWDKFAKNLIPLVALAAAIYVAIYILQSLGSFTKQTVADMVSGDKKGLFILMFKTAVIIALLSDMWFVDSIITPLLQGGLTIGNLVAVTDATVTDASGGGLSYARDISGFTGSGFTSLFAMVNDAVQGFNDAVYKIVAIGEAMVCNATRDNIWEWYFLMLGYGAIIYIFGWLLLISVSFYIIDILITLTFGLILLPFGIAFAISGKTSGYTRNIWNLYLNSFFNFIVMGIVLGFTMQLIALALGEYSSPEAAMEGGGGALNMFLNDLNAKIDANQVKELSEQIWSNGSLLLMIVCFALIAKLVEQMGALADKISGTSSMSDAGRQVGGAISQPLKDKGMEVAAYAGKLAVSPAKHIARAAERTRPFRWAGERSERLRGWLTGSGPQGYRAFWHKNGGWR